MRRNVRRIVRLEAEPVAHTVRIVRPVRTALHHAAQSGQAAVIEFLLSLNTELRLPRAPIEADTNAEERPLHLAAQVVVVVW